MKSNLSADFIEKAATCFRQAEDCLEVENYGLCVARAAEAVEFALKAAILAVGGSYERKHDVSGDLVRERSKFPQWFWLMVPRFAAINRGLAFLFPWARYGDELIGAPSDQLFSRIDAIASIENAQSVYQECSKLCQELHNRVDP